MNDAAPPLTLQGLDIGLTDWLNAAQAGGLPQPARDDRWQPMRAGVVNLWEFEAAEYWYARGWVQLTGRNETGKSSLMALTTLIPWLGDTSSANIDTLGRSGKKFRYYVEPTGNDGDRRGSNASTSRGWLWVEYGRLVDGDPQFFTSLLFAEARAASGSISLVWCTAEGPRVRAGLDLAPNRFAAHPKDLAVDGFVSHPTATAYKHHVATHLLGSTTERLEAAGRMLRVTRTPKLGAQLEIGFVSEQLRLALPELDRGEVEALAAGWDQLDQIRAELASTTQAVASVEQFRKTAWLGWVRAQLRERADAATRARTDFDRVTRGEREAVAALTENEAREQQVTAERETAQQKARAARAAADELQASTRYLDARERLTTLERRRQDADRLRAQQASQAEDLERAQRRSGDANAEATAQEQQVDAARRDLASARDVLARAAAAAHLPITSAEPDLPLLQQRLSERKTSIGKARGMLRSAHAAEALAVNAENLAADKQAQWARDQREAGQAWTNAEMTREALAQGLADWAAGLSPLPGITTVDTWIAALPSEVDEQGRVPGKPLVDLVRTDWFDPEQQRLHRAEQDADIRLADAQDRAAELAEQIDELRAATTPVFEEPRAWHRRARPDASPDGAPLWSVLEPRPDTPPAVLASVEAALAATGLLDAWVTADGVYATQRDGDDAVVSPAATRVGQERTLGLHDDGREGTLSELLEPSREQPTLTDTVDALLRQVRLLADDEPLPAEGLAVGVDGRWRGEAVAGRAAPLHAEAEWIGESARAAQRRRAIEEMTRQLHAAQAQERAAASDREAVRAALVILTATLALCPSDDGLRISLVRAAERERTAERSAAEASQAEMEAARLRTSADTTLARMHEFCTGQDLPPEADGLDRSVDAVNEANRCVDRCREARHRLAAADGAYAAARNRLADCEAECDGFEQRWAHTSGELNAAAAAVRVLEATVGADDQAILAELAHLKHDEDTETRRDDALGKELLKIGKDLGEARATRDTAQQRRIDATLQRDGAFSRFRVLIDRGLADEAGLDLPDLHATAVDKVREQVSVARRQLDIPRWPEDAEAQSTEVKRRANALNQGADQLRQQLESSGRSLNLSYDDLGLPVVGIQVDATGLALTPREASTRLAQIHADLDARYSKRVQETLDELLGSTFLEHLRERIGATNDLVAHINGVLAKHPVVTTSTSLRIMLEPVTPRDSVMLDAFSGSKLANPDVAERVREHLRGRIEEAKRLAVDAGEPDWRDRLAETLDYRRWLGVHLQKRVGTQGRWTPLTNQGFAEMSGGARAVSLMLPLVATLAALYREMDGAPRPLWLDEAFDGLDSANRSMVMDLFRSFDFDVLLAGPTRLVNVRTVPAAAIYQVVRAPAPLPGVDLTLELWAGGDLVVVDLPATLPIGAPHRPEPPRPEQDRPEHDRPQHDRPQHDRPEQEALL